jgi:hypothetical protein
MNFSSEWDASAAARWKKQRRIGKILFVLKGGVGGLAAGLMACLPLVILGPMMPSKIVLEYVLDLLVVLPLLLLGFELATWNRMETAYRDYSNHATDIHP